MSRTLTFGTEDRPIDVEVSDEHIEYFVDGVAGMAVGYPVSKMILTSKNPYNGDEERETRKAVCTITVPTEALLDIAKLAVDGIKGSEEFLSTASKNHASSLADKLKSLDDS